MIIKRGFIYLAALDPVVGSKDPGPEGPALVHPGGVMKVATFTSSVQVSGVSN
jgi:mRNA-degrading endonuclease toxin of MazEF toxin-antitoxin module